MPLKESVLSVLDYVREFSGTTIMVKLGGSILQDDKLLESIADDIFAMHSVGVRVVVVHGGGPAINLELERRNIKWNFVDGLRVTTPEMMEVIETVLSGSVNRRIVRSLNNTSLRAVGFSGADAQTLMCKPSSKVLGLVGEIETVNPHLINQVLNMQDDIGRRGIPVIAPVGTDKNGVSYNINADWAASRIASGLGVTKMLFLTDQDGILDPEGKLINELDAGELVQLIEDGTVKGGMLAKAKTVLYAVQHKVTDVHILNARRPHALIEELFTDAGVGTVCRLRSRAFKQKKKTPAPLETSP